MKTVTLPDGCIDIPDNVKDERRYILNNMGSIYLLTSEENKMTYEQWTKERELKVRKSINDLEFWLSFVESANECAYTDSVLNSAINTLLEVENRNVYEDWCNE